jgi:hypothetical protein
MNENFEASLKKRDRKLSRFMARELLLDYAEGRLDEDRRKAVEEYLPGCKETQQDLEALRAALSYTKELSRIEAAESTAEQIEHAKLGFARVMDRVAWRNWPEGARWSVEAVLIAGIVAAVVSLLPLQKLANWLPNSGRELVLAEIAKEDADTDAMDGKPRDLVAETLARPAPGASEPDEPAQAEGSGTSAPVKAAGKAAATAPGSAKAPAGPATGEAAAAAARAAKAEESETDASPLKREKAPKGFVYRAFMATRTIDATTGAVRDIIESLGGERAGQVELGWRKNSGTYFHFALPESNYESLLENLRSFGPVRIYKDPHWRVMPSGQIRLILFVEDLNPNPNPEPRPKTVTEPEADTESDPGPEPAPDQEPQDQ